MVKRTLRFLRYALTPVALAAAWGTAEAAINRLWGLRATWRPVDFWESAFDRAVWYLVVAAVVMAVVGGAARLFRRRRAAAARAAPWGLAAAAALAVAVNAGWLVLALTQEFEFRWWFLAFDVREPGGFATYWGVFLAGAVGATAALGFLLGWLRRRLFVAGSVLRAGGVVLFGGLLAYHLLAPAARPVASGPDVVFIVLDAWRADNFNAELMPKTFAWAQRYGIVYRNARAPASWTAPSMGSVFTGEYPDVHARRYLEAPWRRPPTVARLLYDAGYDTRAVNGNRLLQRFSYIVDGFDDFYYGDDVPALRLLHFYDTNWYGPAARNLLNPDPSFTTSQRLASRLEKTFHRRGRRPRFIWVHFMDPHTPYAPPPEYYDAADQKYVDEYRPALRERAPAYRRLYDAECRFLDDLLAPRLEELVADGRTAVVLASDHGEEFWEHKTYEHGKSVYETVLRVPLVIVPPGERPRADFKTPVTLLDLGPTLLDFAGVQPPPNFAGRTLLRPEGEAEFIYVGSEFTESFEYKPNRRDCVIAGDWKLILPAHNYAFLGELYDLRPDPEETDPWVPQDNRWARELREVLGQWKTAVGGPAVTDEQEDVRSDLRALGYVR
ncbi:MAG: sulfatase [Candidatus Coatesbacteria bacterium]|nr:MAG: sulfatase [Candidatus Coatesbacteria bacterium]